MIRDRSIRTKLALVVLGPVLVMMALGAAVVRPALAEVADADRSARLAEFVLASMQYRDEVEHERFDSIALGRGVEVMTVDQLLEQRATTDAAREDLRAVAERTGVADEPGDVGRLARAVLEAATALDGVRADLDAGAFADAHAVDAAFREILAPQQDLLVILRSADQAELVRRGDAIAAYYDAEEALSDLGAFVGAGLDEGMSPDERREAVALERIEEDQFERFQTIGEPVHATALAAILEGDTHEHFEELLSATVGSGTGSLAARPEAWWPALDTFFDEINDLEEEVFVSFVDGAAAAHDAARTDALLAGGATLLASLLAVGTAFGFGRRLAARVRRLSDEARTAAADELPRVLDEVGDIDPAQISEHLPVVDFDGRDEIGILADSFNTVLRTAVETSVEHVQQRSEAMTRLLTSLGRRNQALIDRQLGILDDLEARVDDDEVLDGLFRVDHMLTRLRRNSENLLVLASDRPARPWTRHVPLLDVVRAALAEIDDLRRVDIDLGTAGDRLVAGTRAVDLSHLLAELIDNALAYSPPTEPVAIRASVARDTVRLWIIDRGVGMSPDDLAEANRRITQAHDITEVETDRIGFQVVGRLAARLEIDVALQANPGGGLAASVDLGEDVFAGADDEGTQAPPTETRPGGGAQPTTLEPPSVAARPGPSAPPAPPAPTGGARTPVLGVDPAGPPAAPGPEPARREPSNPAPTPADAPAPQPAGFRKRVPGEAIAGTRVQAAQGDAGLFRRLPDAPATPRDPFAEAEQRRRALAGLQAGVQRGRTSSPPPDPPTRGRRAFPDGTEPTDATE